MRSRKIKKYFAYIRCDKHAKYSPNVQKTRISDYVLEKGGILLKRFYVHRCAANQNFRVALKAAKKAKSLGATLVISSYDKLTRFADEFRLLKKFAPIESAQRMPLKTVYKFYEVERDARSDMMKRIKNGFVEAIQEEEKEEYFS